MVQWGIYSICKSYPGSRASWWSRLVFWVTRYRRPEYCYICPLDDRSRREFVDLRHFRTLRQASKYVAKLCRQKEASDVHES
ncbi:hypothetical protein LCGC14_1660490 [marine sediment metagenome]|uniref:Uncharacterized protein n=1 Tax=marine sediment metagenome TaxID=412755 RepID=A0A0F9IGP1_9ZZZZ